MAALEAFWCAARLEAACNLPLVAFVDTEGFIAVRVAARHFKEAGLALGSSALLLA